MTTTIDPNSLPVEKGSPWHTYLSSVARRQKIADKAIHKALDLPDDDDVQITNVKSSGASPWATGAVALLGVVAGAGLVSMLDNSKPAIEETSPAPVTAPDTDTKYGYEFRIGEPEEANQ